MKFNCAIERQRLTTAQAKIKAETVLLNVTIDNRTIESHSL